MSRNFHYAAYSYLDEYLLVDKLCIAALDDVKRGEAELCCEALVRMATYYRIIRNLSPKHCKEKFRLSPVLDELNKIERPACGPDAIKAVDTLKKALKARYGQEVLSAASKFLWMRFRSPIVIYDSLASEYLNAYEYPSFYSKWKTEYEQVASSVREATAELVNIRRFTLAANMSDRELSAIVGQDWFCERVFDHWIVLQAESARQATSLQLKDG